MVRHWYGILLFGATIGAVVVCLRPQWGAAVLARLESWVENAQAAPSLEDEYIPQYVVLPPSPPTSAQQQITPPLKPLSPGQALGCSTQSINRTETASPYFAPALSSCSNTESAISRQPDDSEQILPGESVPYEPPAASSSTGGAANPPIIGSDSEGRVLAIPKGLEGSHPNNEHLERTADFEPPKWWSNAQLPAPSVAESLPRQPTEEGYYPERSDGRFSDGFSSFGQRPGFCQEDVLERVDGLSGIRGSAEQIRSWPLRSQQKPVPDPSAEKVFCEGARVLARVGSDVVLMSDLWVTAEQFLISIYWRQKSRDRRLPSPSVEEIWFQRESFVQAQFSTLLSQLVDAKLAYYDAVAVVGQEALKNMEEQVARHFEKVELPKFFAFYQVQTYQELDARLRQGGTSVARHRRLYFERSLAAQWLAQKVKVNEEVGYEEMWAWYQANRSRFEQPAQARWEQISVRISKYPSRQAAWAALAHAGNQVLDGRPFAEVARQYSDAPNAAEGGQRDWTTQGSLRSEILDQAIFSLPVGAMSPILEDGDWLHIVRVIDRQEARRIPFEEAQVKIREEIRKQRSQIQQQAYLDQLRQRVPVWTVLDQRPSRTRTASLPPPIASQ
ncbi:MAG: peptidyl-prolyl cis-trans isomerase [Thermoguttaceae bacterium]|nr:peptidyl-prolyl cis-trans isomerase [Thermoguttaceae bacterium]MDW8036905.1 peptidylprolyl isomerase [Thermoguttaceae bacterium]